MTINGFLFFLFVCSDDVLSQTQELSVIVGMHCRSTIAVTDMSISTWRARTHELRFLVDTGLSVSAS
jgi:hypothetical protein